MKIKMTRNLRENLITYGIVIVAFIIVESMIATGNISSLMKGLLVPLCVYVIMAVSLNLTVGILGELSLGHAGFMCVGAFTGAFFSKCMENVITVGPLRFILAILIGAISAGLIGFLIGMPVLRLKSDYFAIATLGFAEVVRIVAASTPMSRITNGSLGLTKIPGFNNFYIPFIVVAICIAIIALIMRSTYGRAFKAIRDDEIAAESMGINLARTKLLSFVISSFFAGIGGALMAMYLGAISSTTFTIAITYFIFLIVVIGGMSSISGSVISAFVVISAKEWWLRFLDQEQYIGDFKIPFLRSGFRMVVFSVILMIVVLFFKNGLLGNREFSWDRIINAIKKPFQKGFKQKGGTNHAE